MSFLGETKRRKVFQVAAVYAVVAWLLIQIVATVEAPLNLPDWVDTLAIVLLAVGFPITLIISWAFNLTPEGLVREGESQVTTQSTGRRIEYALIGLLVLAVGFILLDTYVLIEEESAPVAATPTETPLESSTATLSSRDRQSIAVLPFANLSSDPEQEFFFDGMTEEITSALAKIPDLQVVGRTSAFQFKGENQDLTAIGRALNATHLLEGSVRKAGIACVSPPS